MKHSESANKFKISPVKKGELCGKKILNFQILRILPENNCTKFQRNTVKTVGEQAVNEIEK